MVSDTENESVLGLKKAKNLGKIGVCNGFKYGKWISFRAKKAKNLGKIVVSNGFQIWKMNQF